MATDMTTYNNAVYKADHKKSRAREVVRLHAMGESHAAPNTSRTVSMPSGLSSLYRVGRTSMPVCTGPFRGTSRAWRQQLPG
jgi:hypothetical protein